MGIGTFFRRKNQESCFYVLLYAYVWTLYPPFFPSHGQVSAGLIIPQVEEDVVTKIM
jgi:hypothetical protein